MPVLIVPLVCPDWSQRPSAKIDVHPLLWLFQKQNANNRPPLLPRPPFPPDLQSIHCITLSLRRRRARLSQIRSRCLWRLHRNRSEPDKGRDRPLRTLRSTHTQSRRQHLQRRRPRIYNPSILRRPMPQRQHQHQPQLHRLLT